MICFSTIPTYLYPQNTHLTRYTLPYMFKHLINFKSLLTIVDLPDIWKITTSNFHNKNKNKNKTFTQVFKFFFFFPTSIWERVLKWSWTMNLSKLDCMFNLVRRNDLVEVDFENFIYESMNCYICEYYLINDKLSKV